MLCPDFGTKVEPTLASHFTPAKTFLMMMLEMGSSVSKPKPHDNGPPCCKMCPYNILNTRYNAPSYDKARSEAFGGIFGLGNPVRDGPWGPTRYKNGKPSGTAAGAK